jgi:hypothetical protein
MTERDKPVRIQLTPEQKEEIKRATGADIQALELTPEGSPDAPEELEERIAPASDLTAKIVVKGTFVF